MRADITFDTNNYVNSLNVNPEGEYELPEGFVIEDAFYYHLVNNELVLDEDKKAQSEEDDSKRMQIEELTLQLKQSDEDMLDFLERLFSFKNPLTFITDMINLMKDYATLVATRQDIREQIKNLQK